MFAGLFGSQAADAGTRRRGWFADGKSQQVRQSINTSLLTRSCKRKKKEKDVKLARRLVLKDLRGKELGMYNMLAATGYI